MFQIISIVPSEKCDLVPRTSCSMVTKMMPFQEMVKRCIPTTREICHKEKGESVLTKVAQWKKWCTPGKPITITITTMITITIMITIKASVSSYISTAVKLRQSGVGQSEMLKVEKIGE